MHDKPIWKNSGRIKAIQLYSNFYNCDFHGAGAIAIVGTILFVAGERPFLQIRLRRGSFAPEWLPQPLISDQ
jgi:hypothetical protein